MNQETFKTSVFVHKDKLFRFARRILVSDDEAYDVVQEILMKLWEKRNSLAEVSNIEAYAMRMVNNECVNRLRKFDVRENYKNVVQTDWCIQHEQQEIKPLILNLIDQLPDKQRKVMHLKDVEELEIKEIAGILEMEENTIRVNLMRARQKVREQLEVFFEHEERAINYK
ncbi:DNA-directed RNA polymerase sigma-70 factor [Empedobacter brevis NBRC 14943 = ATCC 43319]|uniref:DNA-directed RNA polymerase sigma-70 factor n=1 Tax=Empedobacter brevis NBRC 14943 = ATCC 43319 TaxID=1218108 RepID=A0A511NGS0_9FLAO|nr:RNA polymerase sigma factor [Empedobacter brevis]GEM52005.1 DNA-directed RNA polymerase sigma-70 factor [Empedobacter brevis NBRC 14943 = ATCC 43319]